MENLNKPNIKEYLTAQEVAELLNIHVMTVYELIKSGKIPASRIMPKAIRVKREDIEAFVDRNRVEAKKWLIVDNDTGVIECPNCEKRVILNTQSKRLESGKEREKYRNKLECPECGNSYLTR